MKWKILWFLSKHIGSPSDAGATKLGYFIIIVIIVIIIIINLFKVDDKKNLQAVNLLQ